ncbi:MAG: prolyl oligopeptidase family serine peptidase [Planctomycetes bacterium]|nr:prolyl oligopeptidase family serine peptidase [Planctomycetota bacterium]
MISLPRFSLLATALLVACSAPPPAPQATPSTKELPMPGEAFQLVGRDAFLIRPPRSEAGEEIPWVLYAPTLPGLPSQAELWMFERFLADGIAIAGIDVGESYGSPDGITLYDLLYEHLVHARGLSPRVVLLARSRGGLMTLAWGAARPERVAAFAGIYPVCDLRSYPGLERAAAAHGTTAQGLASMLPERNPIERLAGLVAAGVPFFAVHGDRDTVVPLEANSGALAERVRALGGAMELHLLPGHGHDMFRGFFEDEALVAFVRRHAR